MRRFYEIILLLLIIGTVLILCCSCANSGAKNNAMKFAEALLQKGNAKEAVSLMSESLLNESMMSSGHATKKVLINALQEAMNDELQQYDKIKIKYIDQEEVSDNCVIVYLSCVSINEGLFNDSEHSEDIVITMVKENGKWRVESW